MRHIIEKALSTFFSLFLFGYLAIGIHEQFHYLMAEWLGIHGGFVTFPFGMGFYNYPAGVAITPAQDALVGLAGGLGTGLVYLVGWWITNYQLRYTRWELDDTIALQVVMLAQFLYAPFDAFFRSSAQFGMNVGLAVAFIVACLAYGRTWLNWLQE